MNQLLNTKHISLVTEDFIIIKHAFIIFRHPPSFTNVENKCNGSAIKIDKLINTQKRNFKDKFWQL